MVLVLLNFVYAELLLPLNRTQEGTKVRTSADFKSEITLALGIGNTSKIALF